MLADQLRPAPPEPATLVDESETDPMVPPLRPEGRLELAYMTLRKRHSIDPVERLIGLIERRTEMVGIFADEEAITRQAGHLP